MKRILSAGAIAVFIGFSSAAFPAVSLVPVEARAQGTSIEGCLLAGSASDEFLLTTGAERHTVVPGAGVDLAAHLNRRVQLTGALEKGAVGQVFRVTAVTVVAANCAAS